jgi:hypothetical protein
MPPWRQYEEDIYEMLRSKAQSGSRVEFDVKLPGRRSGTLRQVDIYVAGLFAGDVLPEPATLAVDCKCWSSTVNVPDVEQFIGLVDDVGTDFGLMITTVGFSEAAKTRAAGARGVQIDVITFEQLEEWRPGFEFCEVCDVDPESDKMPGMMYLERFAPRGAPSAERLFVGQCDRCQAIHVRCSCGTVTGVPEFEEGEALRCEGCGRSFSVDGIEYDRDAIEINDSPHLRLRFE